VSKRPKPTCRCKADETWLGATETQRRGRKTKNGWFEFRVVRSTRVHHRLGDSWFWHWKDQKKVMEVTSG